MFRAPQTTTSASTAFPARPTTRRGSSLVLVLAFLSLIAALLWLAAARVQSRASDATAFARDQQLQAALHDAVQLAMQRLADDQDLRVDTLRDGWAADLHYQTPAGLGVSITTTDLNQRFDLNNLALQTTGTLARSVTDIITDLVRACQPDDLEFASRPIWVEPLKDAIDPDNEGDFEDPEDHRPRNRELDTRHDLLLVPLIDTAFFQRPRPEPGSREEREALPHPNDTFTILPSERQPRRTAAKVNINTAPIHVLRSLVPRTPDFISLVNDIAEFRKTNAIRDLTRYSDRLPPEALSVATLYLATHSTHFEIDVRIHDPRDSARGLNSITGNVGGFGEAGKSSDANAAPPTRQQRIHVKRTSDGEVQLLRWLP